MKGLLLGLLVLFGSATAQPYVASQGFDRPWQVGASTTTTRFAVAATSEGPVVFWSDSQGIWSRNVASGSATEMVVEGRGVREVAAGSASGSGALAYAIRDLSTGRSLHYLRWQGEERLLLDTPQPYPMAVTEISGEPAILMSRLESGTHRLKLLHWSGDETIVRRSQNAIARFAARGDLNGELHVSWLEGFTERGAALGPMSQWDAYLARVGPDGVVSEAQKLGPARNLGLESRTALGPLSGRMYALWPGPDGEVYLGTAGEGQVLVGSGSPVGIEGGFVYWVAESSVKQSRVAAAGDRSAEQSSGEAVTIEPANNVVWSPVTIEVARVMASAEAQYLIWYGPTRGLDYLVYASDNRQPLSLSWQDRLAQQMGWSPWGFWEAFIGQLLGALFAAVLISVAALPVVWLLGVIALRFAGPKRTSASGLIIGAGVLVAVLVGTQTMGPAAETSYSLIASPLELLLALAVALSASWFIRRRSDSEPMIGIVGGSLLVLFVGFSILGFLTFQQWLAYWEFLNG